MTKDESKSAVGWRAMDRPIVFGSLTTLEARNFASLEPVLVQPIGAIEQHGPHLPLSTDLVLAQRIAEAAVGTVSVGTTCGLLPAIAYGSSNEHAWAAGTLSVSTATMLSLVDDLCASAAAGGIRRIAIINGHGGNSGVLSAAIVDARCRHGALVGLVQPTLKVADGIFPSELGMGMHGGAVETSMMLHLAPDMVDLSKATRNVPDDRMKMGHMRPGGASRYGWISSDFGDAGHIGDPTLASAEVGAELFSAAVDDSRLAIEELASLDLP